MLRIKPDNGRFRLKVGAVYSVVGVGVVEIAQDTLLIMECSHWGIKHCLCVCEASVMTEQNRRANWIF